MWWSALLLGMVALATGLRVIDIRNPMMTPQDVGGVFMLLCGLALTLTAAMTLWSGHVTTVFRP